MQGMHDDVGDGIERVAGSVPTAIQRFAKHEKQIIEARCTMLTQAAQAAQHLPEHRVVRALGGVTRCR